MNISKINDQDYIKIEDCVHGGLYKIHARNFDYGIYNKEDNGFIGIRQKFGEVFLFTEYHWDIGEPYGTVKPKEFIKQCELKEINEGKWKVVLNKNRDLVDQEKYWKDNKKLFNWLKGQINERNCDK